MTKCPRLSRPPAVCPGHPPREGGGGGVERSRPEEGRLGRDAVEDAEAADGVVRRVAGAELAVVTVPGVRARVVDAEGPVRRA